ncbi:MAG: DUF5320 domain-containing protein [Thermodesulfobacteriota bacterium]
MPGFNRTGPVGAGPMTGGRRGFCNPATVGFLPFYGGYGYGRGLAMRRGFRGGYGTGPGRGFGRGYGWYPPTAAPFYPPVYPMGATSEIDRLKEQANYMKDSLDEINRRIDALEKGSAAPS